MKISSLKVFISEIRKNFGKIDLLTTILFYNQWEQSQAKDKTPIGDRQPWMTFEAIAFLKKHVKPTHAIFEYGGGGSTIFFLDKGAIVNTEEHDSDWYQLLLTTIKENNLGKNWNAFLDPPELQTKQQLSDAADPDAYISIAEIYNNYSFSNYVKRIDQFENLSFDFVVIDGRARPSCIKHAVRKLKVGGCLVLDNADRKYYLTHLTKRYLENFKPMVNRLGPSPYVTFFTQTNIWKKIDEFEIN
jgi:hypothetical protein